MKIASIILIGGKSTRMGRPKFSLQFGDETLLERRVRQVKKHFSPVIVVQAQSQVLPQIEGITRVCDPFPDQGPLMGVTVGLKAVSDRVEWAFVTGCDMPFMNVDFIDCLLSYQSENKEVIIPRAQGYLYPLCALYRVGVWRCGEQLLQKGQKRLLGLVDKCNSEIIDEDILCKFDPELKFLLNVNTPEAYNEALSLASFRS